MHLFIVRPPSPRMMNQLSLTLLKIQLENIFLLLSYVPLVIQATLTSHWHGCRSDKEGSTHSWSTKSSHSQYPHWPPLGSIHNCLNILAWNCRSQFCCQLCDFKKSQPHCASFSIPAKMEISLPFSKVCHEKKWLFLLSTWCYNMFFRMIKVLIMIMAALNFIVAFEIFFYFFLYI